MKLADIIPEEYHSERIKVVGNRGKLVFYGWIMKVPDSKEPQYRIYSNNGFLFFDGLTDEDVGWIETDKPRIDTETIIHLKDIAQNE